MNLIILTEKDSRGAGRYAVSDSRAEHIRSILKLSTGDTVEIGMLDGPVGIATIESIDFSSVTLTVEETQLAPQSFPSIDIICAVPRPQTLKKVLLTSAMMGVRNLHLVRANRTEKSYLQSPLMSAEQQEPFLLEGLSQGKRTHIPQVTLHPLFRPFVEDTWPSVMSRDYPDNIDDLDKVANTDNADNTPTLLLADMDTTTPMSVITALRSAAQVVVAIGPEGGWIDYEVEHFTRLGFIPFCLGPWVLRVENALTAALAQVSLVTTDK